MRPKLSSLDPTHPLESPLTDVALPPDVTYPADGFALFPDRSVVACASTAS